LEAPGQEILTRDKVTLRVNISAVYDVVNAASARAGAKDVNELLYRTLQIAVRQPAQGAAAPGSRSEEAAAALRFTG